MTTFDRIIFVTFLNGEGDSIIEDGTRNLIKKARVFIAKPENVPSITINSTPQNATSVPVNLKAALSEALGTVDRYTKIYLRGHGNWKSQTLGGWKGTDVVELLKGCGLTVAPAIISVTGCWLARAVDQGDEVSSGPARTTALRNLLDNSLDSFAGQLHRDLNKSDPKIKTKLYARIWPVSVKSNVLLENEEDQVYKITAMNSDEKHHRPHSKIAFTWNGDQQTREWFVSTSKK